MASTALSGFASAETRTEILPCFTTTKAEKIAPPLLVHWILCSVYEQTRPHKLRSCSPGHTGTGRQGAQPGDEGGNCLLRNFLSEKRAYAGQLFP